MANSEAGTSDVAQALGAEYQVFLNFRGEDTRYGFTGFLYHNLVDAGVRVFRDEDELQEGEVIGGNLLKAIDNSIIYIPIFSPTYPSSKWCLRELVHILHNVSMSEGQKSILPIFFHVEPNDIKLKTQRFVDDFLKHEEESPNEVEAWRKALGKVDEIKGWKVKKDQSQAAIVELVVEKVLEKLEIKQKAVTEHLVGLDDRVKDIMNLLDVNRNDVRLIGIYGMGGIGKTTLAKVIFNQLSSHFGKCCSFVDDVRESSLTKDGIVHLQKKLLSDIVGSRSAEKVKDSEQGIRKIGKELRTKKVLVVLDDVNNEGHIKRLIGNNTLHPGSRIIVTTRNISILRVQGFKGETLLYEMPKMDYGLALQLFCRHAFGRDFPSDDYCGLSSEIVSSMGGLPLAIEVIGSLLNWKKRAFWEETLVRLRNVPEEEILKKLRISYDDLDEYQQYIFLDIACFLFNEKKTDATYMWADCQFYPERGVEVLTSRCLIKILDNDKFWIHDQLIDMGRQIVRQESPSDLRKRSRLWIAEEALEIIRTKERKDKVQAMKIDGQKDSKVRVMKTDGQKDSKVQAMKINRRKDSITIKNKEFERLQNLRFLKLSNGTFAGDFAKCRSKLRWISWHPPRQDFRADNMYLDHLVVFKLDTNGFTDDSKAWDLIKRARNLKVLSLTGCAGIKTMPDFSKCLGLERLTLAYCSRLERIESFIGHLRSLIELKIEHCGGLTELPEQVGALLKLKHFSLRSCLGLRELPDSFGNLTSLIELDLSYTSIAKLPNSIKGLVKLESFLLTGTRLMELSNSIGKLKSLRILRLSKGLELSSPGLSKNGSSSSEHHVWQLPNGISLLENLEELDLSGNDGMKGEIPVGIGELSSLRILNLECTCISGIPRTIYMLYHLQTLNLIDCHGIEGLPELPTSLTCLLLQSKSLLSVPNLSNLTNLVELLLSDGSRITEKSNLITGRNLSWIGRLSGLIRLNLNLLDVLAPPELASLSHLEVLTLSHLDLENLVQLPSSLLILNLQFFSVRWVELRPSFLTLRNLTTLNFDYGELEDIPLDGLPQLANLTVRSCKLLQRLSIPLELRKLRQVYVSSCPELLEIQVVGLSKSLRSFRISECESLRRIGGLSYLKNLENLNIRQCNHLTNVEDLHELESLKFLNVRECTSLRKLIDASCTKISDDCLVTILGCGDIKDSHPSTILGCGDIKDSHLIDNYLYEGISLKRYREKTLMGKLKFKSKSDKMEHPFTIRFHFGVKKSSEGFEFAGGIKRENESVTPDSVTYKGLVADAKGFGFRVKRMWYKTPGEYRDLIVEIKSDLQVKGMVQLASQRGLINLYVEGHVESEWKGEYDDEMMEMLTEEWRMKPDVYSDEDGSESDVSSPNEDSDSASVGESETHGTCSIGDF